MCFFLQAPENSHDTREEKKVQCNKEKRKLKTFAFREEKLHDSIAFIMRIILHGCGS